MTIRSKGMAIGTIEKYCGIGNANLRRIVDGDYNPSWDLCKKLAEACGQKLHVALSELSEEEVANRKAAFPAKREKALIASAKKRSNKIYSKSLIKG